MAPSDDYKQLIDESWQAMTEDIKKVTDKFKEIVDRIAALGEKFTEGAAHRLSELIRLIARRIKKLVGTVAQLTVHHGPVLGLIVAGFDWTDRVKSPVSNLSGKATDPASANLSEWTGGAKSEYDRKAGQQKAAIDDIVKKSEFISAWLLKIAKGNVDYAVGLAKIVTDMLGKLISAAEAAGTVAGALEAIGDLAEASGDLIEAGLNNVLDTFARVVESLGDVRDLAGQAGDYSALPDRHWPQAVRPA